MAELAYTKSGRLLFTKEMKRTYTVLIPQMLPVHFGMLAKCLEMDGLHIEMLNTTHRAIVDTGLKYVHNDTCYPALLVVGQLIEALQSGAYDPHRTALMITQTGGGCRASNYIHLLRKALEKADLAYVPVISLNLSGLEKNPGFSLKLRTILRMAMAMFYGDILCNLANQCRPYETEAGSADALVTTWENRLLDSFTHRSFMRRRVYRENLRKIAADFSAIPMTEEHKPLVGVVGEIYVKFSSLGNNALERFLLAEGAEPVVPGLADFILFKVNNRVEDVSLYGGLWAKRLLAGALQRYLEGLQADLIAAIAAEPRFRAPEPFSVIKERVSGYLGYGNKMGEGWLLTAEMLDLIHSGVNNIVCAQPFGCLPNHVAGKGMIRRLKDDYPQSNIVAVDYDPSATRINQENRIKLMLSNADRMQRRAERTEPT